ncbi:MAG TPA: hypothetical protein VD886_13905 [Herpetosiphonaceae bacterium]|nr:hypothetical protein [Herpetosiphonaceae bacterium]
MQTFFKRPIALRNLMLALGLAVFVVLPAFVLANPAAPGQPAANRAAGANPELWRLGFASEGEAGYSAVIGRLASNVAGFRSNRGVSDIYYLFPAPAHGVTVDSARVHVLASSGTYSGTVSLALEVRDLDGALLRTASAAPLDLENIPAGGWTDFSLSTTVADLAVDPGEVLLLHAAFGAGSRDDLDVRAMFEVAVK